MRPTTAISIQSPTLLAGVDTMSRVYTPTVYSATHTHEIYLGGLAVGGKLAGEVLGGAIGKVQRLSVRKPLPDDFLGDDAIGTSDVEYVTYVYDELRIGESSFIPYWRCANLTPLEGLRELFRGYYNGKEAEARQRETF